MGITMRVQLGIGFLVLVIPGPDPGMTPNDGVRGDPRIRSGDDDEGAVHPAESFSDRAVVLMSMGLSWP
jgi:hypothetical protein